MKRYCQCYQCNKKWTREENDNKTYCPKCKSWDWFWLIDGKRSEFDRGIKDKI